MKRFLIFVVLAGVVGGIGFLIVKNSGGEEEPTKEISLREVKTAQVSELGSDGASVTAFGQVVSSNSVSVVSERPGVVRAVNARLGDTVRPGQVIVQLQNSSERQAVLQAQAQLDSARATLTNTTRGADSDRIAAAEAQIAQAQASQRSTESNVLATLEQTYGQIDALIARSFGEYFNNSTSYSPNLNIDEIRNETQRLDLENQLADLNRAADQDRNFDDPEDAIDEVQRLLAQFRNVANNLREAVVLLEPSASLSQATLSRWSNDLANARNAARPIEASLTQLNAQLTSAETNIVSAEANLRELRNGANTSDVTIAQSSVGSARANVAAAQIELAKTQITSPIFGRISSIDARVGQLIGSNTPAFVITSSGSKRVDISVSEQEARRLSVGDPVTINDNITGSISRIAPSIDTNTGKVKIEIFPSQQLDLVEGAGVKVSIDSRTESNGTSIPIESVFVRSGTSFVYVVNDGIATPREIQTAGLFGPFVEVTGGLSPEDEIVISARGVKDNEKIRRPVEEDAQNETELEAEVTSTTTVTQ